MVVPMLVIAVPSQLTYRRQNPGRSAVDRLPDGGHRRGHRSVHRGRRLARPARWRRVLLACPAALLGTVGAVYNAWVLLVEIVR